MTQNVDVKHALEAFLGDFENGPGISYSSIVDQDGGVAPVGAYSLCSLADVVWRSNVTPVESYENELIWPC